MSVRLLFFNDPHYTRHQPRCRTNNYSVEILDKFRYMRQVAEKVGAKAIGCSGDWFHRKGKVTFRESIDVLSALSAWKEAGIEPLGILGNHDIAGHSLDSLDNRAVGVLVHSKTLTLLDRGDWKHHDPYTKLKVSGTSYFHGCDSDDASRLRMYGCNHAREDGWLSVHLCHGTLINKGSFFGEYTLAQDLIELLDDNNVCPDVLVCGHLHFSEGIKVYKRPSDGKDVMVCRVGSLGRVSADDMDRVPSFVVLAAKRDTIAAREVHVKDVSFDIPGFTEEVTETPEDHQERIHRFVESLTDEAESWSLRDYANLIQKVGEGLGVSEEAIETATKFVEENQ